MPLTPSEKPVGALSASVHLAPETSLPSLGAMPRPWQWIDMQQTGQDAGGSEPSLETRTRPRFACSIAETPSLNGSARSKNVPTSKRCTTLPEASRMAGAPTSVPSGPSVAPSKALRQVGPGQQIAKDRRAVAADEGLAHGRPTTCG